MQIIRHATDTEVLLCLFEDRGEGEDAVYIIPRFVVQAVHPGVGSLGFEKSQGLVSIRRSSLYFYANVMGN